MKNLFTSNCYRLLLISFFLIQQTSIFNNQLKAQSPGDLDLTFGTNGKVTTPFGTSDTKGNSVALQTDGKIVVAGSSKSSSGSYYNFALARYNTNGTLDYTFGTSGTTTTSIGITDAYGNSVAIQADGKIVVAGYCTSNNNWGSNNDFALARYNTNGTLDNTFGTSGIVMTDFGDVLDKAYSVVIQANGKILVAGESHADFALARYNTNGTLDNTFSTDGKLTTAVWACVNGVCAINIAYSVVIQPDGKILAAGESHQDFGLVRYNTDGSLDSSFSSDGIIIVPIGTAYDAAHSVALQADGKIIIGGYYDTYINYTSSYDFALARYNTDGTIDSTFSSDGIVTTAIGPGDDYGNSLAVQADGKILFAGSYKGTSGNANNDFALARYNTDGTLDNTFSSDGKLTTAVLSGDDFGKAVVIQPDGKIIVAGSSTIGATSDFALVRYWGDVTVSTDEIWETGGCKIYPNPTKGVFTIQVPSPKSQVPSRILKIEIYDVYGNLVTTKQCVINKEINISTLPKGVYFIYIKVQDSSNVVVKKIVKI